MKLRTLLNKYGNCEIEIKGDSDWDFDFVEEDDDKFRLPVTLKLITVKLTEMERLYLKSRKENYMFFKNGKWRLINVCYGDTRIDEEKSVEVNSALKFEGLPTNIGLLSINSILGFDEGEYNENK